MMFGGGALGAGSVLVAAQLYTQGNFMIIALAVAFTLAPWQAHEWSQRITWPKALVVGPAFAAALVTMFAQAYNPFLYFQF
jgi:hypothetical protein